jgi:hypothetical protein
MLTLVIHHDKKLAIGVIEGVRHRWASRGGS